MSFELAMDEYLDIVRYSRATSYYYDIRNTKPTSPVYPGEKVVRFDGVYSAGKDHNSYYE